MASLYVGDLAPDVTEAHLYDKFNAIGPVLSIRVCRDNTTAARCSLGYAYVNFQQPKDAEQALETLNGTNVNGKPCHIRWSRRDPSLQGSGVGNSIIVKNLDKTISYEALYDTFTAFGGIQYCKVAVDKNNMSKGYAFIDFETQESARTAIQKVNGMLLTNKKVFVEPYMSSKERMEMSDVATTYTNLYIKNFSYDLSDEQLRDMFAEFGQISSCIIMRHPNGTSRGFGFVNYENHEAARKAVEQMNNKEFDRRHLYVGRAQKKSERTAMLHQEQQDRIKRNSGVNLYVKNLDDVIDDNRLRREFSEFGTITSAKVMTDNNGVSKGFGFVCFSSPEEATKAVTEMNSRIIVSKPLYVALAQSKKTRKLQLAEQALQRMMILASHQPEASQVFQNNYYTVGMPQNQQQRFYPPVQQLPAQPHWQNQRIARGAAGWRIPGRDGMGRTAVIGHHNQQFSNYSRK